MHLREYTVAVFLLVAALDASAAPDWQQVAPSIHHRSEGLLIEHNTNIFHLNGFTFGLKIQNSVEKYSPATDTWTLLKPTSTSAQFANAVTHNGLVTVGNDAWIIGGRIGSHPGKVTDQVWIYDLTGDNWRRGPRLPTPFAGGGAALVNNRIHVFGGFDRNAGCDVDSHFVYDLASPESGWQDITTHAAMPMPRGHFATIVLDDLIYAIGGQNGHDRCASLPVTARNVNHVHVYDPVSEQWSRLANLPFAQSHIEPSTFAHNGIIYIVGGQSRSDQVLSYRPSTDTWKIRDDLRLPVPIFAAGARIVDDTLYVFGGGSPNVYSPIRTTYALALGNTSTDVTDQGQNSGSGTHSITHEQINGSVNINATDYLQNIGRSAHLWTAARGGMQALPDNGSIKRNTQLTSSPMLTYSVNFTRTGKHYIWVRGLGDSVNGEGKSDSLHVGLDGSAQASSDKMDEFGRQWEWRRSTRDGPVASLNIPTVGIHVVNIWMREDGLLIDKIIVTGDSSYRPSGAGPDTSNSANNNFGASSGNGSSAQPRLDFESLDLDFGSVTVGQSVTRQLLIKNSGSVDLNISQILLQGTAAVSYKVSSAVPTRLAAGEQHAINVVFSPLQVGEHVAIVSLLHDPDSSLTLISLAGRSTPRENTSGPADPDDGSSIDGAAIDGASTAGGSTDNGNDGSGGNPGDGHGSSQSGSRYRINVGGRDVIAANGLMWSGDASGEAGELLSTPTATYSTNKPVAVGSNVAALGAVPALFATERYSPGMADMQWQFPVAPGNYQVHLFFAEIYAGAAKPGGRVFDVSIEGKTQINNLDVFMQAGSSHQALVRSFVVNSDELLTLTLAGVHQNPAIKAIAVLPCSTQCGASGTINTAPIVSAGEDHSIVLGDVLALRGQAHDDGLPGTQLISSWQKVSGPGTVTFSEITNLLSTATFSSTGQYRLRLSVSDTELTRRDDIIVTVNDGQVPLAADFIEQGGQVLLEAEAYTQNSSASTHSWVLRNYPSASRGQAMVSGPDIGALRQSIGNNPMLTYTVRFDSPGKRYVWIRGFGDSNANHEGKSDSLHVGINGQISPAADKIDHFPARWAWTNHTRDGVVASVNIPTAGVHTINVWMREDGLRFDKLYLTRDSNNFPE